MTAETNALLRAARAYAEQGWFVFPLRPRSKDPLTTNGFKDATTNVKQVTEWWTAHPNANVAVWPGPSGLTVLDIDGPDGEQLATTLGLLREPTLTCHTGRPEGGRHLYFRSPGFPVGNKSLGLHLDVRGQAGYVVVPPSIHPSGRTYRWEGRITDLAELPADVVARLRGGATVPSERPAAEIPFGALCEGERNNQLARYAGRLVAKGLTADEVRVNLAALNRTYCRPPLDDIEVQKIVASISQAEARKPRRAGTETAATPPALVIRRAADVVEQRAAYLWRPWLPLGSYVDLGGDPGAGKTFLAVEIAASATKGIWPGGERSEPTNVVFLATEDSIELTLKGRLRAAGADMDRITFIEGAAHPDGGLDDLVLERDYAAVLAHVREVQAGLVYIDALVDVLPAHDGKGYTESRQATKLIPRLARDSGAALLATRHMKKAGEGAAWKQSVGSVAYASRARVMLQVYPDRDDEGRRVLTCCKHNTAAYPASLAFRLEGGDENTPPHVGWLGEDHRSANQLAAEAAKTEREAPAVDRAEAWLAERLASGPVESKVVFAEGKSLGLSRSSLYRAAAELNVHKETEPPGGFASGRSSTWSLPSHTFQENDPQSVTYSNSNNLAHTFPHPRTETYGNAECPACGTLDALQVENEPLACPRCSPLAFAKTAKAMMGTTAA